MVTKRVDEVIHLVSVAMVVLCDAPVFETPCIGIRHETKNCWEARCALVPEDVEKLVQQGVNVYVQDSDIRCWPNHVYAQAGAKLVTTLKGCPLIFGVKETKMDEVYPKTTYLIFSHVIKAQPINMEALDDMMSKVRAAVLPWYTHHDAHDVCLLCYVGVLLCEKRGYLHMYGA